MRYLTLIVLLASGCGITVHEDPIKVNPISVAVTHSFDINFGAVSDYCSRSCANDPNQTTCSDNCYANFISILTAAIAGAVPTPTPTP